MRDVGKDAKHKNWLPDMLEKYNGAIKAVYEDGCHSRTVKDTFVVELYSAIKYGCKQALGNDESIWCDKTDIVADLAKFPQRLMLRPWYKEIVRRADKLTKDNSHCYADTTQLFGYPEHEKLLCDVYMMYLDLQEECHEQN